MTQEPTSENLHIAHARASKSLDENDPFPEIQRRHEEGMLLAERLEKRARRENAIEGGLFAAVALAALALREHIAAGFLLGIAGGRWAKASKAENPAFGPLAGTYGSIPLFELGLNDLLKADPAGLNARLIESVTASMVAAFLTLCASSAAPSAAEIARRIKGKIADRIARSL